MEASSVVNHLRVVGTNKEWAGQAPVRNAAMVRSLGIGEGKTRRPSLALDSFVDVCGCYCR
jgi:hypothetical protein